MNKKQAEKLTDLIYHIEDNLHSEITVENLTDHGDHIELRVRIIIPA